MQACIRFLSPCSSPFSLSLFSCPNYEDNYQTRLLRSFCLPYSDHCRRFVFWMFTFMTKGMSEPSQKMQSDSPPSPHPSKELVYITDTYLKKNNHLLFISVLNAFVFSSFAYRFISTAARPYAYQRPSITVNRYAYSERVSSKLEKLKEEWLTVNFQLIAVLGLFVCSTEREIAASAVKKPRRETIIVSSKAIEMRSA